MGSLTVFRPAPIVLPFLCGIARVEVLECAMNKSELDPSMERLDSQISRHKRAQEAQKENGPSAWGLAWAMRLTTEMLAAMLVGGVLGWLIDGWLGTRPWLLIVFLLIGIIAGTLNAYRAARRFESALGKR